MAVVIKKRYSLRLIGNFLLRCDVEETGSKLLAMSGAVINSICPYCTIPIRHKSISQAGC